MGQNMKPSSTAKALFIAALILSLPFLGNAQDCCGPGGGGGGAQFTDTGENGESSPNYRLKGVRHYAYSGRHPGFTVGLESAGLTAPSMISFTPRLEYFTNLQANEKNNFDIYGAAFYTIFIEAPYSHQADIAGNFAWRYILTDKSRLTVRLDSENLFVYFPKESGLKYCALDPSAGYVHALSFGDISFSAGLPVSIKPDTVLSTWLCAGYEHPIGLGVSVCPRFALTQGASYIGTTLTLSFFWDRFYAKAAFLANGIDEETAAFHLQSYFEYTLNHFIFWAGVDFNNIGKEKFLANPFLGAGYNF